MAVSTAFRRRHRFLEAVVGHQPKGVAGFFEADETYFREAQKGSRLRSALLALCMGDAINTVASC